MTKNIESTSDEILEKFFSGSPGPVSTKLGPKHPWVRRIQVRSNEVACPFPRGDNYKMEKNHYEILRLSPEKL